MRSRFAGVGGVDDLRLRGERDLETLLIGVGFEPGTEEERGEEECGAESDFECAADGHGTRVRIRPPRKLSTSIRGKPSQPICKLVIA